MEKYVPDLYQKSIYTIDYNTKLFEATQEGRIANFLLELRSSKGKNKTNFNHSHLIINNKCSNIFRYFHCLNDISIVKNQEVATLP